MLDGGVLFGPPVRIGYAEVLQRGLSTRQPWLAGQTCWYTWVVNRSAVQLVWSRTVAPIVISAALLSDSRHASSCGESRSTPSTSKIAPWYAIRPHRSSEFPCCYAAACCCLIYTGHLAWRRMPGNASPRRSHPLPTEGSRRFSAPADPRHHSPRDGPHHAAANSPCEEGCGCTSR